MNNFLHDIDQNRIKVTLDNQSVDPLALCHDETLRRPGAPRNAERDAMLRVRRVNFSCTFLTARKSNGQGRKMFRA